MKTVARSLLLLALWLFASEGAAREILIPNVAAFVRGANSSFWATEIRLINTTPVASSFRVVEWIGSPRYLPFETVVAPGATKVIGGWELYSGWPVNPGYFYPSGEAEFGAAVCEVDDGLLVVSRTLTSTVPDASGSLFPPWTCSGSSGGFVFSPDPSAFKACNWGVGPMLYADRTFFEPGQPQNLLMLNPRRNHYRTNLVIVNGDAAEATVTIDAVGGAGEKASKVLRVPARTYFQINDIYSLPELAELEAASEAISSFGQRATVTCSTRCFAIAYVISNENNTVSIVEPR